jgi:hypothetical protein
MDWNRVLAVTCLLTLGGGQLCFVTRYHLPKTLPQTEYMGVMWAFDVLTQGANCTGDLRSAMRSVRKFHGHSLLFWHSAQVKNTGDTAEMANRTLVIAVDTTTVSSIALLTCAVTQAPVHRM